MTTRTRRSITFLTDVRLITCIVQRGLGDTIVWRSLYVEEVVSVSRRRFKGLMEEDGIVPPSTLARGFYY